MKRISFKVGDLFAIPLLEGKYVTGRILLCPKKQKFKKIIEETKKEIEAGEKDFPEAYTYGTEMLYLYYAWWFNILYRLFIRRCAKRNFIS